MAEKLPEVDFVPERQISKVTPDRLGFGFFVFRIFFRIATVLTVVSILKLSGDEHRRGHQDARYDAPRPRSVDSVARKNRNSDFA